MALNTVQMGTTVNSTLDFTLQRNTQAIKINIDGYYKLEVWGAGGAGGGHIGGAGGYACGYKLLTNGTTIYVCVGAKGGYGEWTGYNGGANDLGPSYLSWSNIGTSGGCTHFATRDGTLASIGTSNKSSVLVVAGGGGAGGSAWHAYGGAGGGEKGGNGFQGDDNNTSRNNAGTQTTGHAFGSGQGGSLNSDGNGPPGGGGWYGGKNGYFDWATNNYGGGGGSGYVGGVPSVTYNGTTYSPTNTKGGYTNSGGDTGSAAKQHGKAKITLVALTKIPVYFKTASTSNTQLTNLYFNNTKCDHCYFNNTKVY